MKGDAAALEDRPEIGGDVGVERGKDLAVLADDSDLGAEVAERPCHLQTYGTGPDDDQTSREGGQEQQLVGGDRRVDAGQRRPDRDGARGDDDSVTPERRGVYRDGVRVVEPRLAEDDVGARPRERRRPRLELRDDLVLPADDRRPVQPDGAGRGAEARGVFREPVNPSRPYQGLFRDSPPVDAGSPERAPVDERDPRRQADRRFQRVDARCSTADDDQVIAFQGLSPA